MSIRKLLHTLGMSDGHMKDLLSGAGVSLLFRLFGALGVYVFTVQISKYYGPSGSGIYAFVYTLATILSTLANWGLDTYVVRAIPEYLAQKKTNKIRWLLSHAWRRILVSSGVLFFLFVFIIPGVLEYVNIRSYTLELRMAGVLQLPMSMLLITSSAYRAKKNISAYSLLQMTFVQCMSIGILYVLHSLYESRLAPLFSIAIVASLAVCIGLLVWRRQASGSYDSKAILRAKSFRPILREASPMLVGGVVFFIMAWSDKLMLRILTDQTQLGIFDIAHRLSNLSNLGLMAVITMASPQFSQLYYAQEKKSLKEVVQRSTGLGFLLSAGAVTLLLVFSNFWLGLFGNNHEYLVGKSVLWLLCAGQLFNGLCGPVLSLLNMCGSQHIVRNIVLATAGLNIIMNILFVPVWGILGAAMATLIGGIVWNSVAYFFAYRLLGFSSIPFIRWSKWERNESN